MNESVLAAYTSLLFALCSLFLFLRFPPRLQIDKLCTQEICECDGIDGRELRGNIVDSR